MPEQTAPEYQLVAAGCRASSARPDAAALDEALTKYGQSTDPLWPALARHLGRHSTPSDRQLLIHAASQPEEYPEPLCWGLRFMVRGDVMFEDGSVVTLDEFSADAGLQPLPYLEDIPGDDPELLAELAKAEQQLSDRGAGLCQ